MRIPPNRRGDGTFGVESGDSSKVKQQKELKPKWKPRGKPFEKGKPKTGGRQKGTPNKRTSVQEALEVLGYDHIAIMVHDALTTKSEVVRTTINTTFLKYTHPQMREDRIHHSGSISIEESIERIREGHKRAMAAEQAAELAKKKPA